MSGLLQLLSHGTTSQISTISNKPHHLQRRKKLVCHARGTSSISKRPESIVKPLHLKQINKNKLLGPLPNRLLWSLQQQLLQQIFRSLINERNPPVPSRQSSLQRLRRQHISRYDDQLQTEVVVNSNLCVDLIIRLLNSLHRSSN